ncbi:PhoH family protein [Rhodocaloribacter litoris]|uniref:PhoH family protein n=1 Tax=Rhodocaloribacter litoris TaxID=2558931 RepID=UPI00142388AC|nr:PhoH family protein [Rhodocaloribacter litoris]QXD16075.1 PhoH family protein [Rhodocaloribacter litoris]GIV59809.1 MAG: phosphate starvation protein PhoH [Rhodothermaceae bacterium]
MAEKRLTIDKAEPLLLFGFNDKHLRKVEGAFPDTRITARGNQVILQGDPESLHRIERILDELTVVLNRNGNLTENDVETVLALFTVGDGASGRAGLDAQNVVLFTPGGSVKAKTPNQIRLVESARHNDIVFAVGPAGTGKTYTAVALAVAALKSRQVKKIVLSRPAVEAGERLGFLPGDFREKVDPYLRPLYDALEDMLPRDKLAGFVEQNVVEIVPLAYMRGRTLNSAFVILDEAQNATHLQMKMFLTRLGANSRAIITGDVTQTDLPSREHSGLVQARQILEGVEGIDFVYFDEGDVVRHRLVKDIIKAYERYHQDEEQRTGGNPR